MKTSLILFLTIILFSVDAIAQDDLYSNDLHKQKTDSILIKTDIDNIQYNLNEFYRERQTGMFAMVFGASLTTISSLALTNAPDAQTAGMVAGSLISLAGVFITIDAGKWIKKASMKIGPGGIKINF